MCFDLGPDYDYDSLRGEGKAAKARELVALAERRGHLAELEAAIRRERPALDTTYSHERVQELQDSILAASQPDVRDAFIEFTQQIEERAMAGRFREHCQGFLDLHGDDISDEEAQQMREALVRLDLAIEAGDLIGLGEARHDLQQIMQQYADLFYIHSMAHKDDTDADLDGLAGDEEDSSVETA